MRRILSMIFLAAASLTVAYADDDTTTETTIIEGTASSLTVNPKPTFTITYPGTFTYDYTINDYDYSSLDTDTQRERYRNHEVLNYLCNNASLVSSSNETIQLAGVSYETGTDDDGNLYTTFNYQIEDGKFYLSSDYTYTLTMPAMTFTDADGDAVSSAVQTFTFSVATPTIISTSTSTKPTTDYSSTPVILEEGVKLTVSEGTSVSCSQLIVLPGAGVYVGEEASLTVDGSAYFLAPEDRCPFEKMPYLINLGTFTSSETIFTRYLALEDWQIPYLKSDDGWASVSFPFQTPVSGSTGKDLTIYTPTVTDEWGYNEDICLTYLNIYTSNGTFTAEFPSTLYYSHLTDSEITEDWTILQIGSYLYKATSAFIRVKGEINNDESYTYSETSKYPSGYRTPQRAQTYLRNPYQAPIDARKLVDNGRATDVNNVYGMKSITNDFYAYNVQSGITTYDGDMQLGYFVPQTSYALTSAATATWNPTKYDLTTIEDLKTTYSTSSTCTSYPYIRFYVESLDEASADYGNRDVCAVYFVDSETYNNEVLASLNYSSATHNKTWEAIRPFGYRDTNQGRYEFPKISLQSEEDSEEYHENSGVDGHGLMIKVLPEPQDDETVDINFLIFGRLDESNTSNTTDKVKVGILDENLRDIEIASVYLNDSEIGNGNALPTEISIADNEENTVQLEYTVMFDTNVNRSLKITFKAKDENDEDVKTAISNETLENVRVIGTSDAIRIVGAEKGTQCTIYTLNGQEVATETITSNLQSINISKKSIYFATLTDATGTKTYKVAVK